MEVLEITKQKLVAGTDWDWEEDLSDYPASTHQLKYLLKRPNENAITLTATASGDTHVFEIDRASTAAYTTGFYTCQAIATLISDNTDIHEVEGPNVVYVHPDLNTEPDPRSFALKMVDAYQTALYTIAQKTMDSISIEGRNYNYKDEDKLTERLNYWKREAGVKKRQRVLYQFDSN